MNGAFDRVRRFAGRAHPASLSDLLGGIAIPALAAVGTFGVVAVLLGLQCGGLDRCFVSQAQPVAVVTPPTEAPAPAEPRLVAERMVAAAEPAPATAVDARTKQIDTMIVGSFDAIRADDAGWLSGAHSAKVEEAVAVVEEGDGPGPSVKAAAPKPKTQLATVRTSAGGDAAVAAIAALEQPVRPVARPEPLAVTAFAEQPQDSAPAVTAAAQRQLAEVAAKKPAQVAEAETPKPVADTAKVAAEPAKLADIATGDTRTVGGSGVNVRSGPGKSTAKLFALAAGEKVKVGESQHGWFKITDDQGRTGWLYKTYLN